MTYNYDLAGDIQSWTHPAGYTITNSINGAQRITQITSSLNEATHPGTLATIGYTPWGAEQTIENGCAGSGCTNPLETYAYNKRLQPVMIELGTLGNASADYCLVYNYYSSLGSPGSCATPSQGTGDNGNVMGYFYQDSVNSSFSHTASYTYDSLNRLTNAVATGNSTYNLTFAYDRYGNMTCQINGQTQGLCPQYSFNSATNQIMNPGYTYDWAGNLTSDGTNAYGYDAEGQQASLNGNPQTFNALRRLVAFPEPWATLYNLFDPSGRLVARSEPGGELWLQAVVLHEESTALYSVDQQEMYFIHPNQIGSSTENTNETGTSVGDLLFYPWGEVWTSIGSLWGTYATFDGRAMLRSYDSTPGRWLTPDPSNAGADPSNPQTWNACSYAGNNPTTNTDPSGLYCVNSNGGWHDDDSR